MARKYLTNLDMQANLINNVAIHPSGTAPTSPTPVVGSFWYDTSVSPKLLKIWNGTAWESVGSTGTSGVTSVSGTTNQITVSPTTGAAVVSLPSAMTVPGSLTVTTDLTVTGNLTVSGTTTTVNSETLTVNDNVIVLNNNVTTGVPTENGGIEVRRGASTNASLLWNETTDTWQAGLAGAEVNIALTASPTFTGTPLSTTAAADTNTTQIATTAFVVGQAGSATPIVDGTAAVGTSLRYARQDHVHPTDTSRAPLASPALTGTPTAPTATAGTNSTQIATTAYVDGAITGMAKKYTTAIGTGAATAITVTHNLGTRDVIIQVYDATNFDTVEVDEVRTTTTTATLTFASAPALNAYRVVIIG